MSRQNAKTCILLAAVLIVVSSATWFRKEVQTVYRNLEKPGGGVNSGVAVQGSGNKPADHKPATSVVPQEPVKPVEPPVKPGELLQNPEQKDTLRALVLELLVRFNRVSTPALWRDVDRVFQQEAWRYCFPSDTDGRIVHFRSHTTAKNLVTIGGTKIAGEGTWPVCFDKPYWRKDGAKYLYMDGSNNEMEGGRCAQYTFGVSCGFFGSPT